MSEKDIQRLIDLADSKLKQPLTQEEARTSLLVAGIISEDGRLSQPLAELAQEF
jgi:hypothetical protein